MIPLAPWSETLPVRLHMRSGGYWPVRPTSSRMTAQVKPFVFERFDMQSKVCSSCKVDKPLYDYHNDKTKKDGKTSSCKECANIRAKEWGENNQDKVRKNKRAYYERNTSKVKESAQIWRIKNPESYRRSVRKYLSKNRFILRLRSRVKYWNNKEKELKKYAEYREKNRDLCNTRVRNSQKKNPLRLRLQNHKRRDRSGNGKISVKRIHELFVLQAGSCVYCNVELSSYHVDHVKPLAKGGTHTDDNIQLLCPTCNRKKGSKYPYVPK